MNREVFRKSTWWFGWALLIAIPIVFLAQVVMIQDLPDVQPWKWVLLFGAVVLIYAARDRDDVLKHHVV